MAGKNGKRHTIYEALAVTLVLGCLFPTLSCFNLQWASNSVEHNNVTTEMKVRTGRIIVNGKGFKSLWVSAAQNSGPTNVDSGTGVSEWTLEEEDPTASNATLRQMHVSLHCGENTMTMNATGPRAADLELDMGDAQPILLTAMPETCGHSVQKTAQGLIFVVSNTGCNVIKENGNHVFSIRWVDTLVTLTCPIHPTSEAPSALATSDPAQAPGEPNYPLEPWNKDLRKRRHAAQYSPYYYYYYYYYHPYYSYYRYLQSLKGTPPSPTTTVRTTTSPPMTPQKSKKFCDHYPQLKHLYHPMYYYYYMSYCNRRQPGKLQVVLPHPTVVPIPTTTRRTVVTAKRVSSTTRPTSTQAKTTKPCKFFRPVGDHRIVNPNEPYQKKPFDLYFSEKFNQADNGEDKFMPRAGCDPTDDSQSQPHPEFEYWSSVPWLPQEP